MDIDAVKQIERTIRYNPWVFCGIWEVLYRHDDLTFKDNIWFIDCQETQEKPLILEIWYWYFIC